MLKCHITATLLSLIAIATVSAHSLIHRHLATSDSTQIEIPLYSNNQYYFFPTYINNNDLAGGIDLAYTTILALYTSQTLLASNCSAFMNYSNPCGSFDCANQIPSSTPLILPYFEAYGSTASLQLAWNSTTLFNASSFVSSNCTIGPNSYYGQHILLVLGMGTSTPTPVANYFSIYLSTNFLNNKMLLYFDPTKAASSSPVAVLNSDGDWHVNDVDSVQVSGQTLSLSNVSLVFDANSIANYFPQQIYNFILNALQQDFTCYASENENAVETTDSDTYDNSDAPFPICSYQSANISNLPIITIMVGDQEISLPPQVYIGQGDAWEKNITLNLITTDVNSLSRYYVTPTYQNTIILGSSFMTYYYTLFDGTGGGNMISLYLANQNAISSSASSSIIPETDEAAASTTSDSSNSLAVVFGVLFGILLIICIIGGFLLYDMRKKNIAANMKKTQEISLVTLQASVDMKKQEVNRTVYNISGTETTL